jgi:hypothetical protein
VPGAFAWQALLLVPEPVLSLAYLVAIRAERLHPSFVPIIVLAAFPLASAVVGARRLRASGAGVTRRLGIVLLAVAALELVWAVVAAMMVGFAIAWRSG